MLAKADYGQRLDLLVKAAFSWLFGGSLLYRSSPLKTSPGDT